jgi:hypothetical protein
MAKNLRVSTVTIPSSGTTSSTLTLEASRVPIAIVTTSALTGTSMTFLASADGVTYSPVYNEATLYSVGVGTAASRHVGLARQPMEGVRFFQIVSTSTETAARTFTVISGE